MAFKVKLPILYIGGAFSKVYRWLVEDENGVQTPMVLDGYEGKIQARRKPGSPVLAEWSTANHFLILSGNKVEIDVPETTTKTYNFSEAVWDLIVWPTGHPELGEVVMFGEITALKTVTVLP